MNPKFTPGRIVMTLGAAEALARGGHKPSEFLVRHLEGDWGTMDQSDKKANDSAVTRGLRLLSVYSTSKGDDLWVITEHDRSVTTILLPEEY